MAASQERQPTLDVIAPRITVGELGKTLAFYGQRGFALTYHDEGFAIIEHDGIALHLHPSDEPPDASGMCWIEVNSIEALSQKDLPTNAIASPLVAQPWGFKELSLHDPFGNLIILAERSAEIRNKECKDTSDGNRATERTTGRDSLAGWTTDAWHRARRKHRAQATQRQCRVCS